MWIHCLGLDCSANTVAAFITILKERQGGQDHVVLSLSICFIRGWYFQVLTVGRKIFSLLNHSAAGSFMNGQGR